MARKRNEADCFRPYAAAYPAGLPEEETATDALRWLPGARHAGPASSKARTGASSGCASSAPEAAGLSRGRTPCRQLNAPSRTCAGWTSWAGKPKCPGRHNQRFWLTHAILAYRRCTHDRIRGLRHSDSASLLFRGGFRPADRQQFKVRKAVRQARRADCRASREDLGPVAPQRCRRGIAGSPKCREDRAGNARGRLAGRESAARACASGHGRCGHRK